MKMANARRKRLFGLLWLVVPLTIFGYFTRYAFAQSKQPEPVHRRQKIIDTYYGGLEWKGGGLVTFWFDDAWLSQYTEGFPILEYYGYTAALAVPTQLVGFDAYMNWYQVRRLAHGGWEVVSHSRTHDCSHVEGPFSETVDEILGGKSDLLDYGGIVSDIYVAPCGRTSGEADVLVKQYFKAQRLVEWGLNGLPLNEPYAIKTIEVGRETTLEDVGEWVAEAEITRSWLILMFHQIDYSDSPHGTTPEMLGEIVAKISKSGLQVVLPTQVLGIKK